MTEREMRKLSRTDLLEMLLEQSRELDQLRAELAEANRKLKQRQITIGRAGSLAEAALLLNGVFEAADRACEQYQENMRKQEARCIQMEAETRRKCEKMLEDAKNQAEAYWNTMNERVDQLLDPESSWHDTIQHYL